MKKFTSPPSSAGAELAQMMTQPLPMILDLVHAMTSSHELQVQVTAGLSAHKVFEFAESWFISNELM